MVRSRSRSPRRPNNPGVCTSRFRNATDKDVGFYVFTQKTDDDSKIVYDNCYTVAPGEFVDGHSRMGNPFQVGVLTGRSPYGCAQVHVYSVGDKSTFTVEQITDNSGRNPTIKEAHDFLRHTILMDEELKEPGEYTAKLKNATDKVLGFVVFKKTHHDSQMILDVSYNVAPGEFVNAHSRMGNPFSVGVLTGVNCEEGAMVHIYGVGDKSTFTVEQTTHNSGANPKIKEAHDFKRHACIKMHPIKREGELK